MPTAGHNMLHDRHMLRWDVEIWLLPCETTRQRLNISPLSTPSSGRLLFWNLKLAGTCACESGFYFEAFFLLRGTLDEFYFDTLQIRPGQILSWKKTIFFPFFCFVLFFLSFFLFTLPLLSFPFLSLDGSAALGGVVSFELCSFLNSIQIVQMWKTPTDLIIPDIALSRTHFSFVDESCLPDYFSVKPGMFCCRKRKRKSTFKGSSVSLKHL